MRNRAADDANNQANQPAVPDPSDKEVGYLTPVNAYAFIDTIRSLDITVLGFALDALKRKDSLITLVIIEGFCTALAAGMNIIEAANLMGMQCCRRDGNTLESTKRPITQYATYLIFRFASTVLGGIGVGLLASVVSADPIAVAANITLVEALAGALTGMTENDRTKVIAGLVSITASVASGRILSGKKPQLTGGMLQTVNGDVGAARSAVQANNPPNNPPNPPHEDLVPLESGEQVAQREDFEVVVDGVRPAPPVAAARAAAQPPAVSLAQNPNHFFVNNAPQAAQRNAPAAPPQAAQGAPPPGARQRQKVAKKTNKKTGVRRNIR